MDVFLIGDKTTGKNVGSVPFEDEENPKNPYGILPIISRSFNSLDQSEYTNGFLPNIEAKESSERLKPLGDVKELLLRKAIEQITGIDEVCVGSTTTFTTATTGGTWTSSTTSVATINSSGVITGVSAGTATITYNFTNSQTTCSASATKIVTVLAVPTVASIGGTFTVCKNETTTLTNNTAGGVWSSNLTNIATVNPSTGVVTGVSSGTATISYAVTDGGCSTQVSQAVVVSAPNVNPISVTASTLCVGGTITATSTTAGGTWTITNPSIANINSSGVVTGVSAGTTSIVYTVTDGVTGCSNTATLSITVEVFLVTKV